jgi:lipopolysaccharide transport system ATP-binding protein
MRPDRGSVSNAGVRAGMLSLQVGFLDHLSGRENAILSALLLGMERCEVEEKIDSIIEFAGIGDFIDQAITTYSSGMRARLGFSVAFHADPDILLIDEVMGVGDPEFRKKSREVMMDKLTSDRTVVLVSHSENLVHEMCDRVAWIEKGETVRVGPTEEVLSAYGASML